MFADNNRNDASLTAVLDYHRKNHDGAPRFGEHRAVYRFPLSDEWKAWAQHDGEAMSQAEFAEFLEDRISDVEVPPNLDKVKDDDEPGKRLKSLLDTLGGKLASPAKLMELPNEGHGEERVHQAQNLATGEAQIQYTHEHIDEQGAPLKVPNLFLINVPVFNSGDLFRQPVRLRYRVRGGQISGPTCSIADLCLTRRSTTHRNRGQGHRPAGLVGHPEGLGR